MAATEPCRLVRPSLANPGPHPQTRPLAGDPVGRQSGGRRRATGDWGRGFAIEPLHRLDKPAGVYTSVYASQLSGVLTASPFVRPGRMLTGQHPDTGDRVSVVV